VKIDLGRLRLGVFLRGPIVISLEAGEFLRVEPDEPVEVRCQAGRLWITRERSAEDLWLRDGESARVEAVGLTLVEAVHMTRLSIGRAAPATL
jgi:hypothetical protein